MTKAPSSLEEMREMAAQIIEQHQIMHGPDGASLCRRRDGAIDGLVYAEAIRAIPATVQPAQMRVKPLVFDDLGIASDNLLNETIVYRKPEDQDRHNAKRAARILAALEPQPDPRDEHFDDYAVRSFAKMMAAKMAASRAKGRGGWHKPEQCSVEYLRRLLYTHLDKGDPVDVANICMMLRHYEASTAHEYESSAMAAACASRDEVIARLVGALEWYADEVMAYAITQASEPRSAVHGDKGKRARKALAAAKGVQK